MNILVLKNKLKENPDASIRRALQRLETLTGQKFYIDYKDTEWYIAANAFKKREGAYSKYWGFNNGVAAVHNLTPKNTYHVSAFLYEFPDELDNGLGWTHLPLQDGTVPVEIPMHEKFGDRWLEEAFAHEMTHALIKRALRFGLPVKDTLDSFKEDMNELLEENLEQLEPYWDRIGAKTPVVGLYGSLIAYLTHLVFLLVKLPKTPKNESGIVSVEEPKDTKEKVSNPFVWVEPYGLVPDIHKKALELLKRAEEKGYTLRITEGYRTPERQNELYAQGRTKPGKIVTNAKAWESAHNYRVAFDVVDRIKEYSIDWEEIGEIGKSLGLEWGGDWQFKDRPHFEKKKWSEMVGNNQ